MKATGAFIAFSTLLVADNALVFASFSNSTYRSALLSSGHVDLGMVNDAYEKAKAFVTPLNSSEKIAIVSETSFSSERDSWDPYESTDGVSGLNFYFHVSGFVMSNALAQTWDMNLIAAQYKALGDEYFATGYNVVNGAFLGPLGRVPQGGRQNEAFSPDPYLSGITVAAGVKAQQEAGVVAGVRHFLLYEQESNRTTGILRLTTKDFNTYVSEYNFSDDQLSAIATAYMADDFTMDELYSIVGNDTSIVESIMALIASTLQESYSSNADDKTLHEVYMWPWADAINAGTVAIMCAMTSVNGTHSCENDDLLMGKLKEELGFPGFVYPDSTAQFTAFGSANAGLDYAPYSDGYWTQDTLLAGIANGSLSADRLDDMAIRTVLPYYFVGLDTAKVPAQSDYTAWRNVRGKHNSLIREIGGQAISLLKNNNSQGGGLPLRKPETLSLYGSHAGPAQAGPNREWLATGTGADIFEGHLASGSGAGQLSLPYLVTPYDALLQRAINDDTMISWIMSNNYSSSGSIGNIIPGIGGGTGVATSYANYASQSEVCLVFINSWSGEGEDRVELSNDAQDNLVLEVAKACNNTIVVANVAGPRVLDAWIENSNVTAVIYSGLLGQESGNAIADVLYGDVNPSGKLIHTIAKNASDYPTSICVEVECLFDEGVYIDYRWFDANDIEPRYPFGHGLSYTTFTYGALSVDITNADAFSSKYPVGNMALGGQEDLFDEVVAVSTTVSNSGSVDGAEVAQLYLSFPDEAAQPVRVLRGFEKVTVPVGQTVDVTFSLRRRDLSYWDVSAQSWAITNGEYTVAVGSSSRDLRANGTFIVDGVKKCR